MSRIKQKNKIRKSTKYGFIIIAILLIIFSSCDFLKSLSEESMKKTTKEIYNYTNKFNFNYIVNLINNKYITETEITDKTLAYITDLIDTINLDINYEYNASKETSLEYSYTITGEMKVVYTKDGKEQKILDEEETLLKEENLNLTSNKINIYKNLDIDLKEKNALLNEFKQSMGMSIDAKYTITLVVNVATVVEDETVNDSYTTDIEIDLAEKTTEISGKNNVEDTQYISKEYEVNTYKNKISIARDIVFLAIAVLMLKYVSKFRTANRVKDKYRQELNRILKICQDKIVETNTKPIDNQENLVYVKDFGEIVKVSEELFKPILYYFDSETQEAWFSVMTGSVVYRFILKN